MSSKWSKAFKIGCWYCGKPIGVVILQEDVVNNKSKNYGLHYVCQKCLETTKEITEKVLPIM